LRANQLLKAEAQAANKTNYLALNKLEIFQ
jgi:hypothetical protein